MTSTSDTPSSNQQLPPNSPAANAGWRDTLLAAYPWLGFVLPLVVFLAMTSFEPTPPPAPAEAGSVEQTAEPSGWFGLNVPYSAYPYVYTLKVALSIAAIAFVWPTYRQFPFKLSPLAFVVGAVGVVIWVGICHLQLEQRILPAIRLGSLLGSGQRSAFNPLVELAAQPAWAWGFLTIRFIGLALVVPVIEEFFLRGFLMRACVSENWPAVPFGTVNLLAVAAGTVVPMAMHPGELFAALIWFSMVTGLMVLTRNIWDCVAAHATTNLLLGIYVVVWNQWHLM
ncbi:MAG TPA: CAAX prenyl protease-related protein [Pirellulales bacterium]|jgi:hypothetical protein